MCKEAKNVYKKGFSFKVKKCWVPLVPLKVLQNETTA